jgi:hypothetical protein
MTAEIIRCAFEGTHCLKEKFASIKKEHAFFSPVLLSYVTLDYCDSKENLSCSYRLNLTNLFEIQDSFTFMPPSRRGLLWAQERRVIGRKCLEVC